MYTDRTGLRFRLVCLTASHTVRKPKPNVNPAARAASRKSCNVLDMIRVTILSYIQTNLKKVMY